jgi:4-alpha-glucanotransferase
MNPVDRLAALVGIESSHYDMWGNLSQIGEESKRILLSAMGFAVATDAELEESLTAYEEQIWRRVLEPVIVLGAEQQPAIVAFSLPVEVGPARLHWSLVEETGPRQEGQLILSELPVTANQLVAGRPFERREWVLAEALPEGYHRLNVRIEGAGTAILTGETTLIVAPRTCYGLDEAAPDAKVWGVAAQLYSLRSRNNWGMGDFGDLALLGEHAAQVGAATLGLNPLHPLYPANPGHISPYAPSSRAFLNTLYIDITAVPDFEECSEAQALVNDPVFQAALMRLRRAEWVNHEWVATCKYAVLGRLFTSFQQHHLDQQTERATAFAAFCKAMGPALEHLALFDALHEYFHNENSECWSWRDWPSAYQRPDSPEVQAFAKEHRERITYFQYLQWLADEQLGTAAKRAQEAGMPIGLYLDLAVGVDPNGGAAWSQPDLLVADTALGAPPDRLNHLGQNWGLAPLNPVLLKERAFAPFIDALRSNMRHAGALRIDHVMGLMRLYWIPPGLPPTAGAYVRYPFEALLRIVALESRRHRCLVIGEDLGTVPEGFRETMAEVGILSYRVLYFEHMANGLFKRPADYPEQSLVTVSTHDLPPLAGWWLGRDLDWRLRLALYPNADREAEDIASRPVDRQNLITALLEAGILTPETAPSLDSPTMTADLLAAVYRLLARSAGRMLMIQLEDALGLEEQVNLPGTTDEHPNWRRKLPLRLDELLQDQILQAVLTALREERPTVATANTAVES